MTYHVLLPVEDAAARIEAAMGSVTGHDLVPGPSIAIPPPDLAEIAKETKEHASVEFAEITPAIAHARCTRLKCSTLSQRFALHAHALPFAPSTKTTVM